VRYAPRSLELEVADEGPAGDGRRAGGQGFGVPERVALFGGELHAGRRRGGGWALRARLPLDWSPA
jgi:signal transduction histidine kinase